jgi:hypothetical protein
VVFTLWGFSAIILRIFYISLACYIRPDHLSRLHMIITYFLFIYNLFNDASNDGMIVNTELFLMFSSPSFNIWPVKGSRSLYEELYRNLCGRTNEKISQDRLCPVRDSNRTRSKYKA